MKTGMGGPIRLTDQNNEHLGFILMAGEGYSLDAKEWEGDCIFMPLPQRAALFEGRPYLLLAEHKQAGEHRYRLTTDGKALRFVIRGHPGHEIYVIVGTDGQWGEWGWRSGQGQERMGFAHRVDAEQ
jgi:hypothetical protein